MGKFPNSPVHKLFSDWHWKTCARDSYLTDIDRLWVEIRDKRIVGAFDLKIYGSRDEPTWAERIAADEFEKMGIPWYNTYLDFDTIIDETPDLKRAVLYRHKENGGLRRKQRRMTGQDFARWIDRSIPTWE